MTAQVLGISEMECMGEEYPTTCTTSEEWRLYLGARAGSDLGAWGAGLGGLAVLATVILVMMAPPGS